VRAPCVLSSVHRSRLTVHGQVCLQAFCASKRDCATSINITAGYVGLAEVALVLNETALVGALKVQSLGNVYMYGNKTGDTKPVR
jgi:hypothetical protein